MRWEPEGKCSTLGAPYSPSPLLPRSSLNTCSIHQTYSTIVFPAQLFCSDSDNTSIPGMWDPQQQIAEEGMQHSTKGSKRGRNGRRLGKIHAVEHKTENPSSVSMNEGERIENHFERAPCCWVFCRLHIGGLWEVVLMCHRKKVNWDCNRILETEQFKRLSKVGWSCLWILQIKWEAVSWTYMGQRAQNTSFLSIAPSDSSLER